MFFFTSVSLPLCYAHFYTWNTFPHNHNRLPHCILQGPAQTTTTIRMNLLLMPSCHSFFWEEANMPFSGVPQQFEHISIILISRLLYVNTSSCVHSFAHSLDLNSLRAGILVFPDLYSWSIV